MIATSIRNKAEKTEKKKTKENNTIRNRSTGTNTKQRLSNTQNKKIKKLFHVFNCPFKIIKVISKNTLVLQDPNTGKQQIINVTEERPYHREQ